MFIKNQAFKDEETLMEVLFDFDLGHPAAHIQQQLKTIAEELASDREFGTYRETLSEDDRRELDMEERDIRLAERLMRQFDSFMVRDAALYGVRTDGEVLLYEMDLH